MVERRRSCVFCLHESRLLAIELEDPTTRKRFWSLPGGAIEAGETASEAAIRETFEETGYQVQLTSKGFSTGYQFRWSSQTYNCTTYWFTAELKPILPAVVDDETYLINRQWLPWPKSDFLFSNNPAFNEAFKRFSNT